MTVNTFQFPDDSCPSCFFVCSQSKQAIRFAYMVRLTVMQSFSNKLKNNLYKKLMYYAASRYGAVQLIQSCN